MGRYDPAVPLAEFDQRLMEAGIQSGGVVPLIAHGKKLGFLGVGSFRADAFSPADQELLGHIAKQIALAVENSLNFERARKAEREVQRQLQRERLMLEINHAVVSQLDLHELFRAISAKTREVLGNDTTSMAIYDAETNQLRAYVFDHPDKLPAVDEGTPIPRWAGRLLRRGSRCSCIAVRANARIRNSICGWLTRASSRAVACR